jgi:hypothetical protein
VEGEIYTAVIGRRDIYSGDWKVVYIYIAVRRRCDIYSVDWNWDIYIAVSGSGLTVGE